MASVEMPGLFLYSAMQTQVFKVDESEIDKIAKRNLVRLLRRVMPCVILISIAQYFQYRHQMNNLILIYLVAPLFVVIPLYLGSKKGAKSLVTLELILNDSGVEKKAEMSPYRKIAWSALGMREKDNGTIDLFDKNVSSFIRWWNGTGRIIIPPEILNREQLLSELRKRTTPV